MENIHDFSYFMNFGYNEDKAKRLVEIEKVVNDTYNVFDDDKITDKQWLSFASEFLFELKLRHDFILYNLGEKAVKEYDDRLSGVMDSLYKAYFCLHMSRGSYCAHFRITKLANEYLEYLKKNTSLNKTSLARILIDINQDYLLKNKLDINNKTVNLHIKLATEKEKDFYNPQVKKNIAFMLDEMARNNKEFNKYLENKKGA